MCPMRSAPDSDVLARYLGQTASPAEQEIVERWAAAHVSHQAELDVLVRAHEQAGAPPADAPTWDTVALWARVHRDLRTPATPAGATDHLRSSARQPQPWPRGVRAGRLLAAWAAIAAILVVGVGLAIGIQRSDRQGAAPAREYTAAPGQRLTATLIDGTQFTLAPASHLRVPRGYGRGARDIDLDGEAYFAVVHDDARPFAVHAGDAIVRDIGTAFDVRAYASEAGVRVAVAEGQVCVEAHSARCKQSLRGGDLAIARDTGVTVIHSTDIAALTGWAHGALVFRAAPLREVVPALARWYAVDIRLGDSTLAGRPYTATFTSEPASDALGALATSVAARLGVHGTTYTLYSLSQPVHSSSEAVRP